MTGTINLYDAKKTGVFQVASIPSVGLLQNLGLRVGTNIAVQNRYAWGGPVVLRVEGSFALALGKDIATQITVKEVSV